ncbi:MAG: methyltransferase domain-containing protein, partial [Azovibrio sp.]
MPLSSPSSWIREHVDHVRPSSQVLDLACGRGRHSRWLAALGHQVLAVDQNEDALAAL